MSAPGGRLAPSEPAGRFLTDARALGIDWSGGQQASRKIWAATVRVDAGRCRLAELSRPFVDCRSPNEVADRFGAWLGSRQFDVAGLDFCFGLEAGRMKTLELPLGGPRFLGRELLQRFGDADTFRQAAWPESPRATDRHRRAPFCPTNLRMYRQTFWGLAALAGVSDAIPPWQTATQRNVIEVLPALLARRLCPRVSYKLHPDGEAGRRQLVWRLEQSLCLEIDNHHKSQLVTDVEGDAVDAVLAALEAAGALAAGFRGPAEVHRTSGEGWIYSID